MKVISLRTERFGAVAGSMFSDTRNGILSGCLFLVFKSPLGWGDYGVCTSLKAKGHNGHYTEHDLLTPLPLN